MPEVTHHFERAKRPMLKKGDYFREVSWEEAREKIAAELKATAPVDFVMLVSPDLTNESLFAAQKFVRSCLGSNNIDSTARMELPGGPSLWSTVFSFPISIKEIARSDAILAVGVDSRFNFSVVGTKVRKARDRGAKLVTIDPRDSNLARYTDDWLRPVPGKEGVLLKFFAASLAGRPADAAAAARSASVDTRILEQALRIISSSKEVTVILGPRVFHYDDVEALRDALTMLSSVKNINLIPLYFGANARGALEMGVLQEVGPGGIARGDRGTGWAEVLGGSWRPRVIYCVGDIALMDRPDCDFLIVQDTYLPQFPVDAFLPAASFAEAGGTLVNMEGRVQEVIQVEKLPEGAVTGFMRADWRIFSDLARALECTLLDYQTAEDVRREIRAAVAGFPETIDRQPRRMTPFGQPEVVRPKGLNIGDGDFLLVAEPGGFRHRGIDISSKAGGLCELALEEGFRMHPDDMAGLGLADGEIIRITYDHGAISVTGPVKSDVESAPGAVFYTRPTVCGGLKHRRGLWPLFRRTPNPARVRITREGS
jgi:predicted molibdopterin-dependent oxidoreductase YjgC